MSSASICFSSSSVHSGEGTGAHGVGRDSNICSRTLEMDGGIAVEASLRDGQMQSLTILKLQKQRHQL